MGVANPVTTSPPEVRSTPWTIGAVIQPVVLAGAGAGTFSGAGETLEGLIAATTKKDNGLVEPLAAAINYLIDNGQYETWLATWGLESEAIEKSLVNPPGLPLDNQ